MKGALCAQYVRCGKAGCRCMAEGGRPHGPYHYLFWWERGRQRRRYVPKAEADGLRARLDEARRERARHRAALRLWMEEYRRMLRECEALFGRMPGGAQGGQEG